LLRHDLLRGSYVPSAVIRDLRDLTRTRATLSQGQSGISSRIQKLLESANIKLASTVTHTMGKSGRAMLDAIVSGEESPERLAGLALGKLRSKIPQLQLALDGRIRDHHRFLLDSLLRQYRFLGSEIQALDDRLEQLGEHHQELADAVARWITVPGIERVAAWSLVAEIGSDMAAFPSEAHLQAGQGYVLATMKVQANGSAARAARASFASSETTKGLHYRTVWRWHFYAGLFCIPFVLWFATTGTIYLFKP
jgi:transposase